MLNALKPTATLSFESVRASPARLPIITFSTPVVTDAPALNPTPVLLESVEVVKFCVPNAP